LFLEFFEGERFFVKPISNYRQVMNVF